MAEFNGRGSKTVNGNRYFLLGQTVPMKYGAGPDRSQSWR